ncbi:hypothetical protein [Candidatus Entotheonella palauensis]|uniref:Uncharacterized protein n=1 Tax=Candidatus Entotheonella gemina TaxID=1429439 RepID=W4M9K7_9BACT|nr:hypothetical protein [Candidatus Entotheonella palauensis]ETX06611.1 MAG: hypothetical protein ETSY2_16080 [Candidatus Entotheonella gemina]
MHDDDMTKAQLLAELAALRQRNAALQAEAEAHRRFEANCARLRKWKRSGP